MFSSISRATPLDQYKTSFVAQTGMVLEAITSFSIKVNGQPRTGIINVQQNDTVEATVTAPPQFLSHDFYYYKINDVEQSFAISTVSDWRVHVKPDDAKKKWYAYFPDEHTFSFLDKNSVISDLIPTNTVGSITQPRQHVLVEPNERAVYFFNDYGIQYTKISFLGAPIDWVRVPDRDSVVVLTTSGEAYEILLNSTTQGLPPFISLRNYSEFTGDLTYVTRLPGEDLITYLRRARSRRVIPPASCITYDGTYLYAGGNGTCWILNPNYQFQIIASFNYDEYTFGIAWLPNAAGALLTTQSNKIILMDINGNFTTIHQGTALGQPANFNGKIYIPEGEEGWILVYDPITNSFESPIQTKNFSPSYTRVADGLLYVCGNDSEKVLVFNSSMTLVDEIVFPEKVTWISVYQNTIIASHFLKDFTILDTSNLYKVIDPIFETRTGPVSHIGSNIVPLRTIGTNPIPVFSSKNSAVWKNGARTQSWTPAGDILNPGDEIAISVAAQQAGNIRVNFILGESAYDYTVTSVAQTYYPRQINLDVEFPPPGGLYSKEITLSPNLKPCLLGLEFGTIRLNNNLYTGNTSAQPGDTVTLEIPTGKTGSYTTSSAPIFTVGQRQYAVPISINPGDISPIELKLVGLTPNQNVTITVPNMSIPSLYDFVIPNYYDADIQRNGLVINGNYFQQFGKGDSIVVKFSSSPKRFDEMVIYILGPHNYKFVAENSLQGALNFMDFGNLVNPYTRVIDPVITGGNLRINSITGSEIYSVGNINLPQVQFISNSVQLSGMSLTSNANLTISGGDSYFYFYNQIIEETTANIGYRPGNANVMPNLAIARNVQRYHEEPVIITQHIEDPDEGYIDLVVGRWNIYNQTVIPETLNPTQPTVPTSRENFAPMVSSSINIAETAWEISRLPIRKKLAIKENLTSQDNITSRTNQEQEKNNLTNAEKLDLEIDYSALSIDSLPTAREERLISRKIFAIPDELESSSYVYGQNQMEFDTDLYLEVQRSEIVLDKETILSNDEAGVIKDVSIDRKKFAPKEEFFTGAILATNDFYSVQLEQNKVFSGENQIVLERSFDLFSDDTYKQQLDRPVIRIKFASNQELLQDKILTFQGSQQQLDQTKILWVKLFYTGQLLRPFESKGELPMEFDKAIERKQFAASVNFEQEKIFLGDPYTLKNDPNKLLIPLDNYKAKFVESKNLRPGKLKEELNRIRIIINIDRKEELNHLRFNFPVKFAEYELDRKRLLNTKSSLGQVNHIRFVNTYAQDNQLENIRVVKGEKIQNARLRLNLVKANSFKSENLKSRTVSADQFASDFLRIRYTKPEQYSFAGTHLEFRHKKQFYSSPGTGQTLFKFTEFDKLGKHFLFVDEIPQVRGTPTQLFIDSIFSNPSKNYLFLKEQFVNPSKHYVEVEQADAGKINIVGKDPFKVVDPEHLVVKYHFNDQKFDDNNNNKHYLYQDLIYRKERKETIEFVGTEFDSLGIEYRNDQIFFEPYISDLTRFKDMIPAKLIKHYEPLYAVYQNEKDVYADVTIDSDYEVDKVVLAQELKVDSTAQYLEVQSRYSKSLPLSTNISYTAVTIIPNNWELNLQRSFAAKGQLEFDAETGLNVLFAPRVYQRAPNQEYTPAHLDTELIVPEREPAVNRRSNLEKLGSGAFVPQTYAIVEDREQLLYGRNEIEFDRGVVWDHEIGEEYGAFATEADAIFAARHYAQFRPYQIYDTDFWSFRVILDTGLVCTLPRGRYAVAWLIRGG